MSKESAPILLMHGTQCRTMSLAQSELLLGKYQKAGSSAAFIKAEGASYRFWNGQWFDHTMNQAVEFYWKQLGATQVAGSARN